MSDGVWIQMRKLFMGLIPKNEKQLKTKPRAKKLFTLVVITAMLRAGRASSREINLGYNIYGKWAARRVLASLNIIIEFRGKTILKSDTGENIKLLLPCLKTWEMALTLGAAEKKTFLKKQMFWFKKIPGACGNGFWQTPNGVRNDGGVTSTAGNHKTCWIIYCIYYTYHIIHYT